VAVLTQVPTVGTPPAPAAQKIGVGLRRLCRDDGAHRPERPATPPNGFTAILFAESAHFSKLFTSKPLFQTTTSTRSPNFLISLGNEFR
jgi:hypothetical protein